MIVGPGEWDFYENTLWVLNWIERGYLSTSQFTIVEIPTY